MNFIPKSEIDWKKIKILKISDEGPLPHPYEFEFWLNEPLASWDVWDYWEKERFHSMQKHLTKDDVLFDIGTESGWCNLLYAQYINPSNIVLIEPTKEFWPNIKSLWEKNYPNDNPKAFLSALLSDKNTVKYYGNPFEWPLESSGDLIDRNKYQYIHDNSDSIAELKLDTWVKETGVIPTALTMDTEGSELLILQGAEEILKKYKPKIWVSIHPDLAERDYGVKPNEVHDFLKSLGYVGEYLATDHEEHWYFHHE